MKDKSLWFSRSIVLFLFTSEIPQWVGLVANLFRLSSKENPTEWRAILPLGGLAAVQYSPKFSHSEA